MYSENDGKRPTGPPSGSEFLAAMLRRVRQHASADWDVVAAVRAHSGNFFVGVFRNVAFGVGVFGELAERIGLARGRLHFAFDRRALLSSAPISALYSFVTFGKAVSFVAVSSLVTARLAAS